MQRFILFLIFSFLSIGSFLAISANAKTFDEYLKLGRKYVEKDASYDKAIVELSEALKLQPDNAEVLYLLGRAYHYKREFDKGIEHLERATQKDPKFANAFCYLSYAMGAKGNDLLQQGGLKNNALARIMQVKAKLPLDKALELDSKNACANTGLAIVDIRLFHNWDAAKKKLLTALVSEPERTTALIYMGWVLFQEKDEKSAEKYLQKAASIIPDNDAWAHFTIGEVYSKFKKWDKAEAFVEKALDINPNYENGNGAKLLNQIRNQLNKSDKKK